MAPTKFGNIFNDLDFIIIPIYFKSQINDLGQSEY